MLFFQQEWFDGALTPLLLQNQAGKEATIPLQGLWSDLLVDLWDRILPFAEFSLLLRRGGHYVRQWHREICYLQDQANGLEHSLPLAGSGISVRPTVQFPLPARL